jgi:hypothetical protein
MASTDSEIVVEDPDEPERNSPAVASDRTAEVVVYLLLLGLAVVLGYDNYKSGIGWASDGPKSGYLPFYLCVILGGAALWGLATTYYRRKTLERTFVTRDQLRRVLQVFVPTAVFCALMQFLGLYVASLLLIAGFMRFIGKIAWWKSIVTALVFSVAMFVTFDVAFDVIMPKGPIERMLGK